MEQIFTNTSRMICHRYCQSFYESPGHTKILLFKSYTEKNYNTIANFNYYYSYL